MAVGCSYCWRNRRVSASSFGEEAPRFGGTLRSGIPLRIGFESGQWFRGRIYPEKCDVSPDGKLLIYFAGKFSPRAREKGYDRTWIAVSRPPYLTALAMWLIGDTWGGQGLFLDDRSVLIATRTWFAIVTHSPPPSSISRIGFSNFVYSFRNTKFTSPMGPFRCFATINFAKPFRSSRSGLYTSSR